MANEFKVRKGLIVYGSGSSTVLDVQGSQGQLFSITDSLSGSLFSANDISGIPVIEAFSDNTVKIGTYGQEGIIVYGTSSIVTGSLLGTASYAAQALTASNAFSSSYAISSSYSRQSLSSSYAISSSYAVTASYVDISALGAVLDNGGAANQVAVWNGTNSISGSNSFIYNTSNNILQISSASSTLFFDPSSAMISSSTTEIRLSAGGQNVFRGLDNWTGTWSDSAVTSYFQTGRNGGNTAFSAFSGTQYNRVAFIAGRFQISNLVASITPPVNFFQVDVNNTNLFSIANTGAVARVGINNISPSASLHISGSISGSLFRIDSPAAQNIIFITGSGNVGFGTATPAYRLDVSGSGNFTNGLTVTGSLIAPSITGSLFGTASYALQTLSASYAVTASHALNASVQTAGTSLYSVDPATSNFSLTGSIVLGYQSGYTSPNAHYSNFIGYQAGNLATNASQSNFFGNEAGRQASNAQYSNFIGFNAGELATNASQSNFIGFNAGQNSSAANNSNFIGTQAGYQATNADNSNFIGQNSGYQATNSEFSTFIGYQTAGQATNASHSVFIGTEAGYQATNAGNSIILGNRAGYQNRINQNNILIGTSVTLPISSSNAINIAGLIFGTGSYFNTITTSSGSVNGRIGINQPTPQYSFDVSGSGNYTNGLNVTGSSRVTGSHTINNYTLPITDGTDGQVMLTDGSGIVVFDDIKVYAQVKNISGTTLLKGTPLHATASASPPGGNVSEVIAASASLADAMPATFVLAEDLTNGAEGRAISVGYIAGVNTSGFTVGDIVYVGANGGYTNIKPTGSNLIQNLGVVTRVDAVNGSGFIYGSGRSNAVPNLLNGQIFWGEGNTAIQKPLSDVISGSNFRYSGSFTGSLQGTASYATQAFSSSYALTASYALNGGGAGVGSIETDGTSLYSTDPATSGFSTVDGIFFGDSAGLNASGANRSIFLGKESGKNAGSSPDSVMIGTSAGIDASGAVNSIMIGTNAGTSAINTLDCIFIGSGSGQFTNIANSIFIGNTAGENSGGDTIAIGNNSGVNASGVNQSIFIGNNSGINASTATNSNFIGSYSGESAANAYNSNFIGTYAGSGSNNANQSVFIGDSAGVESVDSENSTFIGFQAGYNATQSPRSVFIGRSAGKLASAASDSTFIGMQAGEGATNAAASVFIGATSGFEATSATYANFIGYQAGNSATNAATSNFIGRDAGNLATNAANSNFIGYRAGISATNASHSVFLGTEAGESATNAGNSIIIGHRAGYQNKIRSNNILIGTAVTLPISASNAINIAGLIFGTGSYFNTTTTSSGSANGRIGINQPTPQKEFDISGSLRVSRLSTSLTAPTTSGTTKMVITDTNGDLSFTDVPSGGSLTIAEEGASQGTATFLNFSGSGVTATITSNTASIIIPGFDSVSSYSEVFTNQTLLTVTHNLSSSYPFVQLYDTNNDVFIPQRITATNANQIEVEFSSTTSGRVAIAKAGHVVSAAAARPEVELRTTNPYTLVLSDAEKYLRLNDTVQYEVVIPAEVTSSFATGSIIAIEQRGSGRVKVGAGPGGVTLNYYGGQYTAGQYAVVQLIKVGTDNWTLIGGTAL